MLTKKNNLSFIIIISLTTGIVSGLSSAQTGNVYYVDPIAGNDSNSGTESLPWQTVTNSIPKLSAGDLLYFRDGIYNESNIPVDISGTSGSWITLRNYPGEDPVINGSFSEFRTVGNTDWEVYDQERDIYRSVQTYPSVDNHVVGYLGADDENWKLLSYERFDPFISDNEDYSDDGNTYCGPGLYFNSSENKIYIRLQHSKYQHDLTRFEREFNIPENTDARQTEMYISPYADRIFYFDHDAAYIEIDGIDLKYTDYAVFCASGSNHITLKNCIVMGGRYCVRIRNTCHNILIDNVQFEGNIPPWMARSDVKSPSDLRPMHLMQGAAISLEDGPYNIEITNCILNYYFDAIDATRYAYNIHIHDNEFNVVRDDILQLGSGSYNIEVNNNYMLDITAGISWHGHGHPPAGETGTKFFHHNILDASFCMLYGRTDPNDQLDDKHDGPFGTGMATGRAFGMHRKDEISGADPWKVYHNTIFIGQDVDKGGTGFSYRISHYDEDCPHMVFNNIVVQTWDEDIPSSWYASVMRGARIQDGSQIFDGNLYYRILESPYPQHDMFREIYNTYGGSYKNFARLDDFKNDTEYIDYSKLYYPPGWLDSCIEANPLLNEDYRPDPDGPAASGAVDLSGFDWPGLAGETFRGALPAFEDTLSIEYIVNIYPNPCRVYSGENTIIFTGDLSIGDNIRIYDISGRMLHDSGNLSSAIYQLSNTEFASGIYFFVLKTVNGQRKTSGKFCVIR